MANFFQDTKNKIQDLFIYIVSCGKSSNEPSRNNQGPARDVPLGDDLGLQIFIPEEDQTGPATNITPIRFSKEPIRDVVEDELGIIEVFPAGDEPQIKNKQGQGQGHLVVIQPENIIAQEGQELDESTSNISQEQKEINDEDFEPLPEGIVIPEERANFSTPPGKRSAPKPKTG